MLFKMLRWPLVLTAAALLLALLVGGWSTMVVVGILIILEVSLSFDNAAVNSLILERLNEFWQKIFLSVGVLIAVFGMRLVFPLAIICIAAGIGPIAAVNLALADPNQYSEILHHAHPAIAAFGGMFLLLLFLDWLFEEREIKWLVPIEELFIFIGKLDRLPLIIALGVLAIVAPFSGHALEVFSAGLIGILTYLLVNGLSGLFETEENNVVGQAGKAAFFTFLYLEVLDASFSFDGVLGALAISNQILVIALGLGVGALYIRTLTVYLVRKGALKDYIYLEHGAMYAIGALAVMLFIGIRHELPEVVTGLVGVSIIVIAYLHSLSIMKTKARSEKVNSLEPSA